MAQRPIRILCFGDSLTSGYTCYGTEHHPYRLALAVAFARAFPDRQVEAVDDGEDGGFTADFKERLEDIFRRTPPDQPYYDYTVVLGGTNDLGSGRTPEATFENLERAWSVALRYKSQVLALTVPEIGTSSLSPMHKLIATRRDRLNALIQGYTRTGFHTFDFRAAFSYQAMTDADRDRCWDDSIHYTHLGYDRMGELVAAVLISKRKNEQAAAQIKAGGRPPRPRWKFRDDDADFVEELSGPDVDLRRGYVVVRRRDLD